MQGVQAPQNTIEHHRSQSTAKKPYGRQDSQKYSRVVLEWCLECTKDCRLDENMKNSALQLHINLQQVVYTWVLKQTRLLSFRGRQMEYLIWKIFVFTVCRHVWYGSNVVHWERMSNTILSWGIYFLFIATRTFHSLLHNLERLLSTAKTILNCAKLLQRRRYVQLMLMLYPIRCSHIYISTNLSDCNEQPA